MLEPLFSWFESLDALALIMILLTAYVGICVMSFASRYLKGDLQYRSFFFYILLLLVSVVIMVGSDDLQVLWVFFCVANLLLVRLMIHKSSWRAARASGILAAKNYLFSAASLLLAFLCFYFTSEDMQISLLEKQAVSPGILCGLCFLFVAAMAQSAIWPFHRWLLSSLNSPSPVSAIMHAGLVNGGGFLLVRFSPLYLQYSALLDVIFVIGMVTAFLGILWKLMQNDVKRMLACSTMG